MSLAGIAATVHADPALAQFPSPSQGVISVPWTVGSHIEDVAPPYVKWQPTKDTFQSWPNLQSLPPKFTDVRKALATRLIGADLYIHGELSPVDETDDYASSEALVNAVLYALHRQAGVDLTLEGGRWLGDEENQLGADRKVYVLSVTFATPVLEPKSTYSTVNFTLPSQLPVKAGVTYLDGSTEGPSTPPP